MRSQPSSSETNVSGRISWSPNDIYSQVMGKERYDCVQGLGFGPTPSKHGFMCNSFDHLRMVSNEERMRDKDTVIELKEEVKSQEWVANFRFFVGLLVNFGQVLDLVVIGKMTGPALVVEISNFHLERLAICATVLNRGQQITTHSSVCIYFHYIILACHLHFVLSWLINMFYEIYCKAHSTHVWLLILSPLCRLWCTLIDVYGCVPPYGSSLFNGSSMSPYDVPFSRGSTYPYNYGICLSGGSLYRPLHIASPTPYSIGSMMGNGPKA
ncbi:RanBP2-type zinc finger protein [Camellia lanceoleosa]|uniref:RanBP2-type zinc finger protein n=1 Tax=Camellia lanceoleosa TaxID=1840588 RepID=A0ACC0G2E4_9ERIC|nr:RanBP2-type zinc finger protein [Camellia lanceoleosa]